MVPLLLAPVGTEQTVKLVKGNDRTKAFIEKLGLAAGAKVTVVSAHGGDLIVFVKDVRVALNRETAARIMVYPQGPP